ncbi:MAG: VWA domain-containing protein [Planctomycetales bacterium]|nr:VWA domain-containing protein [Planctomycetales bacterium]
MMKKTLHDGNIRYWALIASVAVHSAALAVFTGVKLSGRLSAASGQRPAFSVQTIEQIVQQPLPRPKPKIEPILPPAPPQEPVQQPPLVASPEPPPPAPRQAEPVEPEAVRQPETAVNEVEFFGQKSVVQRICYVVDCSGSMYGRMYQVREQLKESILKLNPQQAFGVVFFMDGQKILASGNGTLESATARAKSQTITLIESIRPAGSTDAAHAIGYAMRLKDPSGDSPELMYFLTDGFDLDSQRTTQFAESVRRLRNSLAPGAVVHTIGFGPQPQDSQTLRQLASDTGGEFIEVN